MWTEDDNLEKLMVGEVSFKNWKLKHKGWALKKERIPASYYNMDEPGRRYT